MSDTKKNKNSKKSTKDDGLKEKELKHSVQIFC